MFAPRKRRSRASSPLTTTSASKATHPSRSFLLLSTVPALSRGRETRETLEIREELHAYCFVTANEHQERCQLLRSSLVHNSLQLYALPVLKALHSPCFLGSKYDTVYVNFKLNMKLGLATTAEREGNDLTVSLIEARFTDLYIRKLTCTLTQTCNCNVLPSSVISHLASRSRFSSHVKLQDLSYRPQRSELGRELPAAF